MAGQCSKLCRLGDKNLNVITVVLKNCRNHEIFKAIRDEERHERDDTKKMTSR